MTDPLGKVTTWEYDLRGRLLKKIFDDNTHIDYTWDPSVDRLTGITWPSTDTIQYTYDVANHLTRIFHNTLLETTFKYEDPYYPRLTSLVDDTGTTSFSYIAVPSGTTITNGAAQLWKVDGPLTDDTVTYGYDALGRRLSSLVGTQSSGATFSRAFDSLGRVNDQSDPLGAFTLAYDETPTSGPTALTDRLETLTYPNGQSTKLSYGGVSWDRRLQLIENKTSSNTVFSSSTYSYWSDGSVKEWTQTPTRSVADYHVYDLANQLIQVKAGPGGTQRFGFGYDLSANRTSEVTTTTTAWANNGLNQITTQTVAGTPTTFTYNTNGALTSDGTRSYQYDIQQRLVKITRPGGYTTELFYNGLDQLTEVKEKSGTTVTRDRYYLWCEGRICEERDQTNAVTRRFSEHGYRVEGGSPANYFYTRDHLGSVREITNNSGTVIARYDYDPYGKLTQVYGSTLAPPFGYAGYFYHAESGLNLTYYRAYDPRFGRWLTRDPIGERGGQNLYGYVGGNPSNAVDPWGLAGKLTGPPNGWVRTSPKQIRWFDKNGNADRDVDWGHNQHHPELTEPHVHEWVDGDRELRDPRNVEPGDIPSEDGSCSSSSERQAFPLVPIVGGLALGAVVVGCSVCPECCVFVVIVAP